MDNENDKKAIQKFIHEMNIKFNPNLEDKYIDPVIICLDSVLSINRQYFNFVVPRLKYFKENFPNIDNLFEIVLIIEKEGYEGFYPYWNYKHESRVKTLYFLCKKFITYKEIYNIDNDFEAMKHWAMQSKAGDYKEFGVKGIGLATYQYLRILLGVSTVKPDVHILAALELILERKVSPLQAISLIEEVSIVMNIPANVIDHNIWLLLSKKNKEVDYIWKDGFWNSTRKN